MVYVPHYQHDIFVSYAHVDDLPFPGVEKGWVSTLVESLEILLAQKLGRREAYSLWMDRELSRHTALTPEILDHLGRAATLLVVLSPGYLASEWCQREKDSFLSALEGRKRAGSRIFLVERDAIDRERRPAPFADLLGYRFWVQEGEGQPPRILGSPWPDPKNAANLAYFDQLTRLSANLAEELEALRGLAAAGQAGSAAAPSASAEAAGPAVYLAEVTDDLDQQAESVRRHLEQAGLAVVPTTWYPREPEAYARAVDADLARCRVFVQLLGALPGKRPPALPQGYVHLQHQRAQAAGLPILQWRSVELEPATIADPAHRALVEGDAVMAVGLEELKQEAVRRAQPRPEAAPADTPADALVFIAAEAGDLPLAAELGGLLEAAGIAAALPLTAGTPAQVRQDLEQNLLYADALIVVYGTIHARWVRDQLLVLRKVGWRRERPLAALAVLEGPPAEKAPLPLAQGDLLILDCRQGLDAAALEPFLAALRGAA